MGIKEFKCGSCGYVGPAYGVPHSGGQGHEAGVSDPFCSNCGKNDKLTPAVPKEEQVISSEDVGSLEDIL